MRPRNSRVFLRFFTVAVAIVLSDLTSAAIAQSQQLPARDERIHSQLFRGNEIGTIAERLAKTKGDITITSDDDQEGLTASDPGALPCPPQRLASLACHSDAVILAEAVLGASHMTDDKSFIYTDWTIRVREVLRDNLKASLEEAKTLTVVRPGGKLRIGGQTVYGIAWNFPEFNPGTEYLLFLTYIPQTGAYRVGTGRSFDLAAKAQEADTNALDIPRHDRVMGATSDELVKNTRAAVASVVGLPSCQKEGSRRDISR